MARDFTLSLAADFIAHVKTRKLCRLLGGDEAAALRLIQFWSWAAEYAPDGELGGIDIPEIEDGAGWRGNPGALFQAMIDAGFIESDAAGRRIHNWMRPGRTGYAIKQIQKMRNRWRMAKGIPVIIREDSARKDTGVREDSAVLHGSRFTVDPDLCVSSPSALVAPDPDARAIPVAPYTAPTPEPYRRVDAFAAATSADFDRVYDKYPRKDARKRAGLAFQALATGYPGGEKALADAILAAFPAMLKRAPYNGPNDKRPFLETVLVERRWEDQGSAPDGATATAPKPSPGPTYKQPRCNLHEENPRARASNVDWCPSCREHKARNGAREGAPKTAAEILTGDRPP